MIDNILDIRYSKEDIEKERQGFEMLVNKLQEIHDELVRKDFCGAAGWLCTDLLRAEKELKDISSQINLYEDKK